MPAVRIPKAPPALVEFTPPPKNPAVRHQKVMSRKKKSDASATEDFRLATRNINVTILHS
jgi:hypothetical protein